MANIYYGDNGFSKLNFKYPYESGFRTNITGTSGNYTLASITKSGGYTSTVAAGDVVFIYLNTNATPTTSTIFAYWGVVSSVNSTTIFFTFFGVVNNAALNYTYALLQTNIVDINDTSNYYSTLGHQVICCGCIINVPGTPYPYALNPATDTLIFPSTLGATYSSLSNYVSAGNTVYNTVWRIYNGGTWSVPIASAVGTPATSIVVGNTAGSNYIPYLMTGFYNGTYTASITMGNMAIKGGTYSGAITMNVGSIISNGTFSGAVSINYFQATSSTTQNLSAANAPGIVGGNFSGTVTRSYTFPYNWNYIYGNALYTPTATCAISNGQLVTTNLPTDPGFKVAGGTFSPIINLSGSRNSVLGAGFP
jgi:hypothetical protein